MLFENDEIKVRSGLDFLENVEYFIRRSNRFVLCDGIPIISRPQRKTEFEAFMGTAEAVESAKDDCFWRKSLMREELFIKVKKNYENLFGKSWRNRARTHFV